MDRKSYIKHTYYKHWEKKNKSESEYEYYELIFSLFNDMNIHTAFEVAIGDGHPFASKLAERLKVQGIDLSEELVKMANQNQNIEAFVGDAEYEYIGKYDLVYCLRSLLLMKKQEVVLINMINASTKYIIFDILNGENKKIIYNEINFRHTFLGKAYVFFKNVAKIFLNNILFQEKYFTQPLTPVESYNFHTDILRLIDDIGEISVDYYGIATMRKNYLEHDKDYRIIYKLTKKGN